VTATHEANTGEETRDEKIEAAVFRRLLAHLGQRTDVQNIDLMGWGGFCRNCLSDWYREAAEAEGVEISREAARERIYGMPYADYKAQFQQPATEEQMQRMDASVAKNKTARGES
jgi:hypothetical protein